MSLLALGGLWFGTHALWQGWDLAGLRRDAPYYLPTFHCGGLILGSLLALARRPHLSRTVGWTALWVILALWALVSSRAQGARAPALTELATAAVILRPPAVLRPWPGPALGVTSYGFYLWQTPLAYLFQDVRHVPAFWKVVPVSLLCAIESWWLFERLDFAGRLRIFPRSSKPAADAGRPASGSAMAKPASIKIRLNSSADTGFFYVTKKNARTMTEKMRVKKYDPVVRKHVEFVEGKIK